MSNASISASAVNELRKRTGGGMMDCKKALQESDGNFEAACEWLRKKGLAAAAKKSTRIAAEGLIATKISKDLKEGAILELNSETDFVAKNAQFQSLCKDILDNLLEFKGNTEEFKSSRTGDDKSISDMISQHVGTIGENMHLRRVYKIAVKQGVVTSYIHNQVADDLGKIGVLVGFETNIDASKVQTLGKQIAMHIAATKPEALDVSQLDHKLVEKERNFIREQSSTSGKPEAVIEKMIEGRLGKFYEQVVLLEQPFVMDGKNKVSQVLKNFAKEQNGTIEITDFARFTLGEGIEKEDTNSAD